LERFTKLVTLIQVAFALGILVVLSFWSDGEKYIPLLLIILLILTAVNLFMLKLSSKSRPYKRKPSKKKTSKQAERDWRRFGGARY
jgi:hypothetical protein